MKKKFWTKQNVIIIIVAVILVAAIVTLGVLLGKKNTKVQTAEASVARGSLSSSISSAGSIKTTGISAKIPLYACINRVTDMGELENYSENFSWSKYVTDAMTANEPILYTVIGVNNDMRSKTNVFHTSDENEVLFTVCPVYVDADKIYKEYLDGKESGEIASNTTFSDFFFLVILKKGQDNPKDIPLEYLKPDISDRIRVDTDYVASIIKKNASLEETEIYEYTVSNLRIKIGDTLNLDNIVFNVAASQLYTAFTVTEYDVASIDAKLRECEEQTRSDGKKHAVYAAVTVNAIDGRKVLAEIQRIVTGSNSGGIAYYAIQAKIIFANEGALDLTVEENKSLAVARKELRKNPSALFVSYADFSYYDPELTPQAVEALGVDLSDMVRREEVLDNYSVAVRVPKTVIYDQLIVPTKCIFYDGDKRPYVTVKDKNKETRVYIKILLSTGSEAAVEVQENYTLGEGDKIVYQVDAGLISSILG